MNFKPSIILKINSQKNPLESFVTWINKTTKKDLTPQTIINQANITLINQEGESIKIKTVRDTKEQLSFGAYQANQTRYFVFLDAHLTTIPAQNALLKSIEEPPINTQIIFVTNSPNKLLETIQSRCQLVILDSDNYVNEQEDNKEVKDLYFQIIASNPGERISLASNYKDRADALKLCNQLVDFLHKELKNKNSKLKTKQITQSISKSLETIKYLEANVNALLAIENCFFELI